MYSIHVSYLQQTGLVCFRDRVMHLGIKPGLIPVDGGWEIKIGFSMATGHAISSTRNFYDESSVLCLPTVDELLWRSTPIGFTMVIFWVQLFVTFLLYYPIVCTFLVSSETEYLMKVSNRVSRSSHVIYYSVPWYPMAPATLNLVQSFPI